MLRNTSVGLVFSSLFLTAVTAEHANSQQAPLGPVSPTEPAAVVATEDPDLAAIRNSAASFVEAFNKADAAAVAAHWTPDGDLIDETGATFNGHPAIEAEYAKLFAEHPGAQLRLAIDAIRLLSKTAAIEDGHALLDSAAAGGSAASWYTAVHVKVDGQWLLSTVRESSAQSSSASSPSALQSLAWLIGDWQSEHRGVTTKSACRWVGNQSFIERTYSVTAGDKETASGVQLIGFNPEVGGIQSWTFTSDGGHAIGLWAPADRGWAIQSMGLLADGTRTTATNLLTPLDNNGYAWQSVNRQAGETPLPDTEEVVLKRIATP